jgi:hypothetical protein
VSEARCTGELAPSVMRRKPSFYEPAKRFHSGVRAGTVTVNHSQARLKIRSGVKAGLRTANHNQTLHSS